MTVPGWDEAYAASRPAPWDIGRPQPAFVRLAEQGLLSGRVLDSGCGTGEQAEGPELLVSSGPSSLRGQGLGEVVDRLPADGLLLEVGRHPGGDG